MEKGLDWLKQEEREEWRLGGQNRDVCGERDHRRLCQGLTCVPERERERESESAALAASRAQYPSVGLGVLGPRVRS